MMPLLNDTEARCDLDRRIALLKPDSHPKWGKMNAGQMICHLIDAFGCATGERLASEASGPLHRTLVKWMALRLPFKWPHGLPTRPEFDQLVAGTPPAAFEADRRRLLDVMERIAATPRDFAFGRHPIFGEMEEEEWVRWAWLHVDHHLRQFAV